MFFENVRKNIIEHQFDFFLYVLFTKIMIEFSTLKKCQLKTTIKGGIKNATKF